MSRIFGTSRRDRRGQSLALFAALIALTVIQYSKIVPAFYGLMVHVNVTDLAIYART